MNRRFLAILGVVSALAGIAPTSAFAEPGSDPTLIVVTQAPTTALGQDFAYTAQISAPNPNLTVRTTVYERLASRSGFERTLDGTNFGGTLTRVTTGVTASTQTITIPLVGSETPGPTLNVTQIGVYPLRIELLRDNAPVGEATTTFLVTVPSEGPPTRAPLTVATVVPVIDAPAFAPDGRPASAGVTARTATGRLGRLAAGLASVPTTPVSVELGGETLESWAELAERDAEVATTFAQLRDALTGRQLVASTYVPVDTPALRNAQLEDVARDEFTRGTSAAADALNARIDGRTARINPVDESTLGLLAARGTDQLVLAPDALRPLEARFTPGRPFLIEAPDRQFRAVTSDAALSRAATSSTNPAVNAQRVLAGLALVALEAPSVTRGITIALPDAIDAAPSFFTALLTGLASSTYLRPATLDTLFAEVPLDATTAGPLVRTLASTDPGSLTVTKAQLERSRSQVDALATLVTPTDPRLERARNALLIAPTSLWTGSDGQRRARAELEAVATSLREAATLIRVPNKRTFQLTGKRDKVPLTFVNASDQPIDVRITLDASRMEFPDGATQVVRLPARKSTTIAVAVAPKTSGTYPFRLTVTTTTGGFELARNTMTINATGVSGVGYFLAIGAALFLAAWWVRYIWKRRRRPGSPEPTAEPAPAERTA